LKVKNSPVQCVYCIMQCPSTVCVLHHAMPQYSVCTASCNAPVQCMYCIMQCPSTVCVLHHAMPQYSVCTTSCNAPVIVCTASCNSLFACLLRPCCFEGYFSAGQNLKKTLVFRCVTPLSCEVIMFLAHINCMVLVCY